MHGLIEELRGEDAPDEEMVAQCSDQYYVEHSRDGAQQGETVAAVAERDRTETERRERETAHFHKYSMCIHITAIVQFNLRSMTLFSNPKIPFSPTINTIIIMLFHTMTEHLVHL